jgi:hypothetical protein
MDMKLVILSLRYIVVKSVGKLKELMLTLGDMASENKKKKAKNSYLANANKTTDKLKRINFYNKVNRAEIKCKVNEC